MSQRVTKIFSEVHGHYDAVNTICSLGTIVKWRKDGAKEAMIGKKDYKLLDIATGTGEFAIELYKEARKRGKKMDITGMDFSHNMLSVAKRKANERSIPIKFEQGDALNLKYKGNSFDVVTSSFALRNVDSLDKFCSEAKRVLKPGGKFVFMDMAKPDKTWQRAFLRFFWGVSGIIGFAEYREAFEWLTYSVDKFDKDNFVKILKKNGFKSIKRRELISGAAFMVTGHK